MLGALDLCAGRASSWFMHSASKTEALSFPEESRGLGQQAFGSLESGLVSSLLPLSGGQQLRAAQHLHTEQSQGIQLCFVAVILPVLSSDQPPKVTPCWSVS